jgi:bifunctional DNA-binding transcriptional regulator/antitoxin component of YhaV-PrlF toxin-antitoxin module
VDARRTRIIEGGKVVIPAVFRKALGLNVGDAVLIDIDKGELRVRSLSAAIARAQAIARRYAPGRTLSDELIADRRAEAARE